MGLYEAVSWLRGAVRIMFDHFGKVFYLSASARSVWQSTLTAGNQQIQVESFNPILRWCAQRN